MKEKLEEEIDIFIMNKHSNNSTEQELCTILSTIQTDLLMEHTNIKEDWLTDSDEESLEYALKRIKKLFLDSLPDERYETDGTANSDNYNLVWNQCLADIKSKWSEE